MTAVNCTYNYTHSGKMSKLCNMYNNNVCGLHQRQELRLLCRAAHGVTSDTPWLYQCLVTYRVCYLPESTGHTTIMEPLVDYPRRHIKHAHLQSWLWNIHVIENLLRLETNKSKLDKLVISISIDQQVIVDRCYISGLNVKNK